MGLNEPIAVLHEPALPIRGMVALARHVKHLSTRCKATLEARRGEQGMATLFAELPSILLRFEAGVAVDRPNRAFHDMPNPHYHQYYGFGLIKL